MVAAQIWIPLFNSISLIKDVFPSAKLQSQYYIQFKCEEKEYFPLQLDHTYLQNF